MKTKTIKTLIIILALIIWIVPFIYGVLGYINIKYALYAFIVGSIMFVIALLIIKGNEEAERYGEK